LRAGDLAAAEEAVWPVLTANAKDLEALQLLGEIRMRAQRYAEAETLVRRVLQLDPNSPSAHKSLAGVLRLQGKQEAAQAEYTVAVKLNPQDQLLKTDLAQLMLDLGQPEQALAALDAIPAATFPAESIPVKVDALLRAGRKSNAEKVAFAAKLPPPVALNLAEVFLRARLPQDARRALEATTVPPKLRLRSQLLRGQAAEQSREPAQAITIYKQALAADPKSVPALVALAEAYSNQGDHKESFATLQRAREQAPNSLEVLRHLVVEAIRAGKSSAASDAATALRDKSAGSLDDLYLASAALIESKDYKSASEILEKITAERPTDAKATMALGIAYHGLERELDARRTLERALQLDPSLAEAEYQLALVYGAEGNIPDAIQHFERTVQLQPHHAEALYRLGKLRMDQGDVQRAIANLEESARLLPDVGYVHYQLGLAYRLASRPTDAQKQFEIFRNLKSASDPPKDH
jgi:tetratricopeptide (TPR) repeat protein